MALLKVLLTHPGVQAPYPGASFINIGNQIICLWNSGTHIRKFMKSPGYYVNNFSGPNNTPIRDERLYFWGEWEGNSFFTSCKNSKGVKNNYTANGVHIPFHNITNRGSQNTDPYVFGECFYYCVCRQTKQLQALSPGSLILFGTKYKTKFCVDTVFIVRSNVSSMCVQATLGRNYSQIYKEETLEQLNEYLKNPQIINSKQLYHSQTWCDNPDYFSFVPCKLDGGNNCGEKFCIDSVKDGISLPKNNQNWAKIDGDFATPKSLWKDIADLAISKGFKLGVKFDEPKQNMIMLPKPLHNSNGCGRKQYTC